MSQTDFVICLSSPVPGGDGEVPSDRKSIIKTYCVSYSTDLDVEIPFLLFAVRDSVNEATGCSPFELVYGHQVSGPLKIVKEQLLQSALQMDAGGGCPVRLHATI